MMADSDTIWDQKSDNSNVNHFLWGITIYKGTHIIQGQAIAICNILSCYIMKNQDEA